jgi:hypothetical protein
LLLLQLSALLLLFLLRHVMADHTARCGTDDAVMARHVSCNSANYGALEAAFCLRWVRAGQERDSKQRARKCLPLHDVRPLHGVSFLLL